MIYDEGAILYSKWSHGSYEGSWDGGGFNKGRFITAEETRREQAEDEARKRREAEDRARRNRQNSSRNTSCHLKNKSLTDSNGRYSGTCSNTGEYLQCGDHSYGNTRYSCLTHSRGTHYGETVQEALDGACGC